MFDIKDQYCYNINVAGVDPGQALHIANLRYAILIQDYYDCVQDCCEE
jgi:hypothetical protein